MLKEVFIAYVILLITFHFFYKKSLIQFSVKIQKFTRDQCLWEIANIMYVQLIL